MTSTITCSGARQMPAFTVPSTQNTAPVLEYRCLYTHDLRRKQKRWQDGLLRFHTFNKRIMVYDESRNYIGDMHWREEDILHDGDEFQLDRGVLVQVGEATGSMEQDLTALLEKRKKAPEITTCEEISHQPVAIAVASPAAIVPSQIRPKPLTAVLGPRRGRTGRAALSTKSPHELRLENENSTWNQDRPPKRQRIESQLERETGPNDFLLSRALAKTRVLDEGIHPAVVGAKQHNRSEDRRFPTTSEYLRESPVRDAVATGLGTKTSPIPRSRSDNEDEASGQGVEPLPKKRSSGLGSSELAAQQRKRKPNQDSQVSLKASKVAKRPGPDPETGYATRSSNITKSIGIASDGDLTFNDQQEKQTSKLLMVSRKPRKKLMYRDLIPPEPRATGCFDDPKVLDRSSLDRGKRKRDPMVDCHKKEEERLKARLNRHRIKEIQRENKCKEFCGDRPEGLSLSHSQDDMNKIPDSHRRTKGKEPKDKGFDSSMTGSCRFDTEPIYPSTRHSSSSENGAAENGADKIPRPASTVHIGAIALAKTDEILLTRPQPRRSEPVQGNEILPVVSTQEPSSSPILETLSDTNSAPPSPTDRFHSSPGLQTQAQAPVSKYIPQEADTLSKPNPDSLRASTKVVQTNPQGPNQRSSNIQPSDSNLSSIPPKLVNTVLTHSPPNDHSMSAMGLQTHLDVHPPSSSTSYMPDPAVISQMPNANPDSLLAFSKIVAPKPPAAAESISKHKPNNQPAFTKVTPMLSIAKRPDETVEVLSSQPPTAPPPAEEPTIPPHPPKQKPDSLPAFTKVIPSKARAPLKKSISDTAAMRPPSALPVPAGKENALPRRNDDGKDGCDGLWSKEAWDLFGCGRDGVECTYEEFKRKEGLM